ncbi:FtsX-like permease family protein [Virgibacillus dakarensis]|uniref:FtsX-like permease family protein n=1 Tax=Virgibacillus dakarensis TaxID=1917889 RepID=UPI000B42E114|nr:ABC transporter permease [Virgibacillus dakarensis]
MTFKQFAFNNVKRNTRQYLSYFLSCMFAVTVFFMYAVVVFHPDIQGTEFRDIVQRAIILSEIIIYGFSFLFVLFSTGAFIKSRKKEYGLLTTLGISKSQLNRMLMLENTIIGVASIVSGLLLGALLTKLFLMVFSQVLGINQILPFYLSLKAIGLTAVLFFIMFELNSLAVVWTLRTNSIMEVFRGSRGPKKAPKFSSFLSILGVCFVGIGYYLAYISDVYTIFIYMIPILLFVVLGTYLLFTQFSIAFIQLLKRKKGLYFKNLNLLTVADLAYKLKDNAATLFMVTTLSAVALTASGVLFSLFHGVEAEAERFVPQDVSLISKGENNLEAFQKEVAFIENSFKKKDIAFAQKQVQSVQTKLGSGNDYWNDVHVQIYAYSDYQSISRLHGKNVPFHVNSEEAIVLFPEYARQTNRWELPSELTIAAKNKSVRLPVEPAMSNLNSTIYSSFNIVVSDQLFEQFRQTAAESEIINAYSMNIPNWTSYIPETEQILSNIDSEEVYPDSQADYYLKMKDGMAYLFFFGIFISVLFFLAAGSILYFRMYRDIDNDLHHYHSLYRIGLTDQEMRKIATRQLVFLFFIPFLVAVVHAAFAFKALQNMMAASVLVPSMIIILFFFVVHLINFFFIRNVYTAKLKKVM